MKTLKEFYVVMAAILFCSCSDGCLGQNKILQNVENDSAGGTPILIANWNLQTFFDGKKDGCEYKEYQKSSDWNDL